MCCFTQHVERVSGTRIFARVNGRQVLVYSMAYAARSDLAMVLPLPVPPRPPEDSVRFVNLDGYPEFFDDLERGWPFKMLMSFSVRAESTPLVVHDVSMRSQRRSADDDIC
jgi:hypothetical protein